MQEERFASVCPSNSNEINDSPTSMKTDQKGDDSHSLQTAHKPVKRLDMPTVMLGRQSRNPSS